MLPSPTLLDRLTTAPTVAPGGGRRPIHETVVTLGTQRNYPRFWCNTRYLARTQFQPGTSIELVPGQGTLTVRAVQHPTGKQVQAKGDKPLIDLNQRLLAEVFGETRTLHVRVEADQILLSIHPIDSNRAARLRDGSCASIFAGAGLGDEAARLAGLRATWAVEWDEKTALTYAENHPDCTVMQMAAHEAAFADLQPVELLLAGVPCEGHSRVRTTQGGKKRDPSVGAADHGLVDSTLWTALIIARVNPRTVVIESAPAYAASETGAGLCQMLRRLGYVVESRVISPTECGYLLERKRSVIVAMTPEVDGTVPSPWPELAENTTPLAAFLDAEVPADAWVDRTTKPHIFERSDRNKAKGLGFHIRGGVDATATRVAGVTKEYAEGLRVDQPLVQHPTRPETYRRFTPSEGKRLFHLRESYQLPDGPTRAWNYLGQAMHVGLFADIIGRATGRHAAARTAVASASEAPEAVTASALADLPLFAAA